MTIVLARHVQAMHSLTTRSEVPTALGDRLARWSLNLLMAFPLVDFTLRLSPIHPIGVIWDKVVLAILAFVAAQRWLSGYRPSLFAWQKACLLYIVFAFCMMVAGSSHPLIAFDGFRADVYYMLYAFLIPFLIGPKDIYRLLHVAVSVTIIIAVHGVYQYITKAPIPHSWLDVGEHVRSRVYSVIKSPNELGAYMALMMPILAGLFVHERHWLRKLLYGLGILPCFATLLFTFDRGSWLSLVLAVLIAGMLYQRKLLVVLAVFVVMAFFLPPIHHRLTDLLSPVYWEKAAQAGRIQKWLVAVDEFKQHPLFGAGIGRYGGEVASVFHLGTYSDGYYFKVLGESGLVGLALFVVLQVVLLREVAHKVVSPAHGSARFVALGAFTGLLAVALHNIVENVFEFAPMAALYFNLAAIFLVWSRSKEVSAFTEASVHSQPAAGNMGVPPTLAVASPDAQTYDPVVASVEHITTT
ncbi:MAG: O-antigen ligase family protein [Alicyclobacillus sp.]|nr:O-antigen ligase family protein [Alicyclobacillus sp.]